MYRVMFKDKAERDLKKLDPKVKDKILAWVERFLVGTENPRAYGKALQGKYSGLWCYRVSNYRIVAEIIDKEVLISVVKVGNRRDIYKTLDNRL